MEERENAPVERANGSNPYPTEHGGLTSEGRDAMVARLVEGIPVSPCPRCVEGRVWDGNPEHSDEPCGECDRDGFLAVPGLYEVAFA